MMNLSRPAIVEVRHHATLRPGFVEYDLGFSMLSLDIIRFQAQLWKTLLVEDFEFQDTP